MCSLVNSLGQTGRETENLAYAFSRLCPRRIWPRTKTGGRLALISVALPQKPSLGKGAPSGKGNLCACDFFTKDVWTGFGKVTYYVLFFIHVGSRRVRIAGMSCQPNEPWVEQQARNFLTEMQDRGEKATHLIKDGDTKFTEKVRRVFKRSGIIEKQLHRFTKPECLRGTDRPNRLE